MIGESIFDVCLVLVRPCKECLLCAHAVHSFLYKNIVFSAWAEFLAENIFMNVLRLRIYHDTFNSLAHVFCAVYPTYC